MPIDLAKRMKDSEELQRAVDDLRRAETRVAALVKRMGLEGQATRVWSQDDLRAAVLREVRAKTWAPGAVTTKAAGGIGLGALCRRFGATEAQIRWSINALRKRGEVKMVGANRDAKYVAVRL